MKATKAALQGGLDSLGKALQDEKHDHQQCRARHAAQLQVSIKELEDQNQRREAAGRESLRATRESHAVLPRDAEAEARERIEALKRALQAALGRYTRERAEHDAEVAALEKARKERNQQETMRLNMMEHEERRKLEELKKKNAILLETRRVEIEGMRAELARLRRE